MSLPSSIAWQVMPQLLSSRYQTSRFSSYDNGVSGMIRLGIGIAIGWFAYEALQKEGIKDVPSLVKVCINKLGSENNHQEEGCKQCTKHTKLEPSI